MPTNGFVSHSWQFAGTKTNPQILRMSHIKKGLKSGGYLIFETYTLEQQEFGPPRNPDFLLGPNELLRLFNDLHIVYYREGVVEEGRKKAIASLVGKKI